MLLNFFGVGGGPEFDVPPAAQTEPPRTKKKKRALSIDKNDIQDIDTSEPRHNTSSKHSRVSPPVSGDEGGTPTTFSQLGISPRLVSALETHLSISVPTRIQILSTPPILRGRDVLLKSETGSGKTLAFLLPILHSLTQERLVRGDGTKALILTPTRELAAQILKVSESLVKSFSWVVPGALMGGERKKSEKARLRKGVTILICTPGRLLDHLLHTESFHLTKLTFLVLDEADRLLDLGFEKDLRSIVSLLNRKQQPSATPKDNNNNEGDEEEEEVETISKTKKRRILANAHLRQTILVSATLENEGVTRLCGLVLHQPVRVGFEGGELQKDSDAKSGGDKLENGDKSNAAPSTIEHHYMEVESRHRLVALAAFLRMNLVQAKSQHQHFKCIVFMSSCDAVDFHFMLFGLTKWRTLQGDETAFFSCPIWALHGRKDQKERQNSFFSFGKAKEGILLCTDVAARGLDLPRVDYIVQYDPPIDMQVFTHRSGRTGRMGQAGKVVVFLLSSELDFLPLVPVSITPLFLSRILLAVGGKRFATDLVDPVAVADCSSAVADLQAQFEALTKGDAQLYRLAAAGFQAFVRAYATYPKDLKTIFHPKKLHVGHVARSFALRAEPKKIKDLLFTKSAATSKTKQKAENYGSGGQRSSKGSMMAHARNVAAGVSEFTA